MDVTKDYTKNKTMKYLIEEYFRMFHQEQSEEETKSEKDKYIRFCFYQDYLGRWYIYIIFLKVKTMTKEMMRLDRQIFVHNIGSVCIVDEYANKHFYYNLSDKNVSIFYTIYKDKDFYAKLGPIYYDVPLKGDGIEKLFGISQNDLRGYIVISDIWSEKDLSTNIWYHLNHGKAVPIELSSEEHKFSIKERIQKKWRNFSIYKIPPISIFLMLYFIGIIVLMIILEGGAK